MRKLFPVLAVMAAMSTLMAIQPANATTYTLNLTNKFLLPSANTIMLFFATVGGVISYIGLALYDDGRRWRSRDQRRAERHGHLQFRCNVCGGYSNVWIWNGWFAFMAGSLHLND